MNDDVAKRVYGRFCSTLDRTFLPPRTPLWAQLPETLKQAWRAAVEEARQ